MSNLKIAQTSAPKYSDSTAQPPRGNIRGESIVSAAPQQWVLEGRVYQATVGTFSTPIVGGGAGTVLDADQPELVLNVPTGTVLALIHVRADLQPGVPTADNDEFEALLAIDTSAEVAAGTYTSETAKNFLTNQSAASKVTARSAYTANTTAAPTLDIELAHPVSIGIVDASAASTVVTAPLFLDYMPDVKPFVVGPAAVVLYAGGTIATDVFASAVWAEFTKAELGIS